MNPAVSHPTNASARGWGGGRLAILFLGIGLAALIGVRIRETLADRAALAASHATHTDAGAHRAELLTARPEPRRWRPNVPVTGTLAPIQEADLGFKTGGRLDGVRAKVGDRVTAGQVMASLDASEAAAQAAVASAAIRAAQAGHDLAKDAQRRTVALFAEKAVSESDNTAVQTRMSLAAAQLEQARAQAQLVGVALGNHTLRAPFAGLVTRAPTGAGKIVGPGETMFHLEDTTVLKLSATVSEADARLVDVGAEVVVEEASMGGRGEATADAGPAAILPSMARGRVTAVLGSLDPQTRRVPITAEIPNVVAPPLLAGAFVRVTIVGTRDVDALVVPADTLRPGSQDELVLLRDGKAHITQVLFSIDASGQLLIRRGIAPTDVIVRAPSPEVHEGDELAPRAPVGTAPEPTKPPSH